MRTSRTRTVSTSSSSDGRQGRAGVTGYVLKVARESVGLTQEDFAECIEVDANTVQSWETGRRPIAAVQLFDYRRLHHFLRQRGASERILTALQDASEADYLLDYVFKKHPEDIVPDSHPLATLVLTRSVADLLAWALTERKPPWLEKVVRSPRRGPVADNPVLSTTARDSFFEHLRIAADRSLARNVLAHPAAILLRWQTYYLSTWQSKDQTQHWLRDMERAESGSTREVVRWTPSWAAARSLVVARARLGDPEPLSRFINQAIASEECETANLNYWAYWAGETATTHSSADFMITRRAEWGGAVLLDRLLNNLQPSETLLNLYVHSLSTLLKQRPYLLSHDPALRHRLQERAACLLDGNVMLTKKSRSQLEQMHFATRLLTS